MYQFLRKYPITKRLKTPAEEVEKYFPGFLAFTDCTEQQIPRPVDNKRKKENVLFFRQEEKAYYCKEPAYG